MIGTVDQQAIAKRFRLPRPPTVVANGPFHAPVSFSRLRTDHTAHGLIHVEPEAAFVFQVMLAPLASAEVWVEGRHHIVSHAKPGDLFLFDLSAGPLTSLNTPFDTFRFYLSNRCLDDMAYDQGFSCPGGLQAPVFGHHDPVLLGLAHAVAAAMSRGNAETGLFKDYVALAFHAHVVKEYGGRLIARARPRPRGGLSPWQLRRAYELIETTLRGNPSISQLAIECEVSESHFARAFRESTGLAPHQWLLKRRVARARELLCRAELTLAEIASACGFFDQSHFTRVFTRHEGQSPGVWRNLHRQ